MCGFVVTTENNKADTYIDAQRFRGPDARGETIRLSDLTFAHVLLDISGEREIQPYITSKGNIMVFNGEMYDSNIPNDTKFLAEGYEKYQDPGTYEWMKYKVAAEIGGQEEHEAFKLYEKIKIDEIGETKYALLKDGMPHKAQHFL